MLPHRIAFLKKILRTYPVRSRDLSKTARLGDGKRIGTFTISFQISPEHLTPFRTFERKSLHSGSRTTPFASLYSSRPTLFSFLPKCLRARLRAPACALSSLLSHPVKDRSERFLAFSALCDAGFQYDLFSLFCHCIRAHRRGCNFTAICSSSLHS